MSCRRSQLSRILLPATEITQRETKFYSKHAAVRVPISFLVVIPISTHGTFISVDSPTPYEKSHVYNLDLTLLVRASRWRTATLRSPLLRCKCPSCPCTMTCFSRGRTSGSQSRRPPQYSCSRIWSRRLALPSLRDAKKATQRLRCLRLRCLLAAAAKRTSGTA